MKKYLILMIVKFILLTSATQALPASADHEKLSVKRIAVWPKSPDNSTRINVCWENSVDFDQERDWVKDVITNTWDANSKIQFTGWNACINSDKGIRIKMVDDDDGPHTVGLGKYLYSNRQEEKYGMAINFVFKNWDFGCCQSNPQHCIEWIAVHEFGHAIAFTRDHNHLPSAGISLDCDEGSGYAYVKCDNGLTACKQGTKGELLSDYPDPDSIMNYCHMYNKMCSPPFADVKLSEIDMLHLQSIYDSPNKDRIEVVKKFLENKDKIDPNIKNMYYRDTFIYAASRGDLDVVKELLAVFSGTKFNIELVKEALKVAEQNKQDGVVIVLRKWIDKNPVYDASDIKVATTLMDGGSVGILKNPKVEGPEIVFNLEGGESIEDKLGNKKIDISTSIARNAKIDEIDGATVTGGKFTIGREGYKRASSGLASQQEQGCSDNLRGECPRDSGEEGKKK